MTLCTYHCACVKRCVRISMQICMHFGTKRMHKRFDLKGQRFPTTVNYSFRRSFTWCSWPAVIYPPPPHTLTTRDRIASHVAPVVAFSVSCSRVPIGSRKDEPTSDNKRHDPSTFWKRVRISQLMPWSIWYCHQLYYSGIYLIRTSLGSKAERNNEKRTVNAICRLKIWRHEMKDICW